MSVAATYEYDWREHYRASREVTRRMWTRWLGWGFAAVALILVSLNYFSAAGHVSALGVFLNVSPWLLVGAAWLALIPLMQRRAAKKLPSRDLSLRGPQTRSLDAIGYHFRGNSVSLDIPWQVMLRAVETPEFFLFFYNKQCAYYFPKRALNATEVERARALLKEGLGNRAQTL